MAPVNQSEAFALPRASGATQVTAQAKITAGDTFSSWFREGIEVSVAVAGEGLPPVEVAKGVSVAELEKGVAISVPPAYAKAANPTTIVLGTLRASLPAPVGADQRVCFLDGGKLRCATSFSVSGGPVIILTGGPIDKPDLCLDVDVK
jgi:hypothetical protein